MGLFWSMACQLVCANAPCFGGGTVGPFAMLCLFGGRHPPGWYDVHTSVTSLDTTTCMLSATAADGSTRCTSHNNILYRSYACVAFSINSLDAFGLASSFGVAALALLEAGRGGGE